MEQTLVHILNGFSVCLQPINLWYTFLGCFLGTIIGVLPGIGPSAGIALLIPVTYGMNPTSALIMMSGIFYGARYGGSTTAILINTPGEASSVMTTLDGYQMALKGRAGAALAVSALASFIAGTLGVVGLTLFAVPLTSMALKFGPAEYFTLMFFAMTAVSSLAGKSPAKAMISTILGLMIATIGIDLQSGQPRYTMGVPELQDGVGFIIAVVGLFAIAEVFCVMEDMTKGRRSEIIRLSGKLWLTREEWNRSVMPMMRGGVIGFVIGVLPGAGGTIASILSYIWEKRLSKHPEQFGRGGWSGGREQLRHRGRHGAAADARHTGRRRDRGHARRVHHVRHPAGATPVPEPSRPGVGPHRQHVHRQHHAADTEPAADRDLRAAALHPERHPDAADPGDIHYRHLRYQRQSCRALYRPHFWHIGLHLPQGRHPGRAHGAVAGAGRHHGAVVPAGDDDLRREPEDFRGQHHLRDTGRAFGPVDPAAVPAAPAQGVAGGFARYSVAARCME